MDNALNGGKSIHLLRLLISIVAVYYYHQSQDVDPYALVSLAALNRRKRVRPSWDEINLRISDTHFRRMFRISRHCFQLLCNKVIANVGESQFKSQHYINAHEIPQYNITLHL